MKSSLIAILFLAPLILLSQEQKTEKTKVDSFAVQDDVEIENAPNFFSKYFSDTKLNDQLDLRTGIQELGSQNSTLFEFPVLLKYNVKKKFRVLVGPKFDIERNNLNGKYKNPSTNITIGVEHQMSKNLTIDGLYNIRVLGNSASGNFYSSGSRSSFKLGSRYKF